MPLSHGDAVLVPGGFEGRVLAVVRYPGETKYRVGFYNNHTNVHQELEFYEFELDSPACPIGFGDRPDIKPVRDFGAVT